MLGQNIPIYNVLLRILLFFAERGNFVDKFALFLEFSTFHATLTGELLHTSPETAWKIRVRLSKRWKSTEHFSDHAAPCAGENHVHPRILDLFCHPRDFITYTPVFI